MKTATEYIDVTLTVTLPHEAWRSCTEEGWAEQIRDKVLEEHDVDLWDDYVIRGWSDEIVAMHPKGDTVEIEAEVWADVRPRLNI